MIRENGATVLNATLVDRRNMKRNLVARVWLFNRYQPHKGGATSFERLTGSPCRSLILPLFAIVECLIPSDRKFVGVLVVAKGTPRTFRSMWVGRTEDSDEDLVVNEIGHVVRARTVRRCVENESRWFRRDQAQCNSFVSQT